jgi:stalled ribosome rescue protein Dom34
VTSKRRYRRGYSVAVLVGLEDDRATVWRVFSGVVKPERTLWLDETRDNPKAAYNFYESIIDSLRPALREGVRSVIVACPPRSSYGQAFIRHVDEHHAWLVQGPNRAALSETVGSAGTISEVAALVRTPQFRQLIDETTSEETQYLLDMLEKCLSASDQNTVVLYSLKEAEDLVCRPWKPGSLKPAYFMLTDKYFAGSREKSRIQRLMQIASNRTVKTRIVNAESAAGKRLTQLGGLVCLAQPS